MDAKDLVNVLVEQNKTYKEMMQFAITSIITLLVIFLAANFFVMRKMRKDEIERIQAEVKADIILGIKEQSLPELKKEMNEQLEASMDKRFELIDLYTKTVSTSLEENRRTTESFGRYRSEQLKKSRKTFEELRGEIYKIEGDISISSENYNGAFNSYLNAGRYFKNTNYSTDRMDLILGRLEKSAESMDYIQTELSSFTQFSENLENVHQHQCDKIIGILKSKPTL